MVTTLDYKMFMKILVKAKKCLILVGIQLSQNNMMTYAK